MSDRVTADGSGLNSVTLAAGGLVVGAVAVALLGMSGVLPLTFTTNDTVIAGPHVVGVPVVALGVVSHRDRLHARHHGRRPAAAAVRVAGRPLRGAVRRVAAWVLLGEAITPTQAVGGAVVLLGLTLARQGDRSAETAQL